MTLSLQDINDSIYKETGWKTSPSSPEGKLYYTLTGNVNFTMEIICGSVLVMCSSLVPLPTDENELDFLARKLCSLTSALVSQRKTSLSVLEDNFTLNLSLDMKKASKNDILEALKNFLSDLNFWKTNLSGKAFYP